MLSPEAMDALIAYEWPSNVRELYRALERAVVLCDDGKIEVKDLPDAIQTVQRKEASVSVEIDNVGASKRVSE